MVQIVLATENVRKRFGDVEAVRGISLDVKDGEFLTFLGPSGCGKTTMLRMVAGFENPTSGRLIIDGTEITRVPPHQRPVGMVFQSLALFPHLNVYENIAFGLRVQRATSGQISERVAEVLKLVDLAGYEQRAVHQLSGGQRQRIALARSLVMSPRILLLDEPLGALDLKLRRQLQIELKALQRRTGTTFLFVTHDQDEAMAMSDRIAVFNKGTIEQVGPPDDVYSRPATKFVADFVGASNLFAATVSGDSINVPDLGCSFPLEGSKNFNGAEGAWISVRPEHLVLSSDQGKSASGGQGFARIDALEFTGMFVRLHLSLESTGQKLTAVQWHEDGPGARSLNIGDRVALKVKAFVPVAA